jgi:hypothetical protein
VSSLAYCLRPLVGRPSKRYLRSRNERWSGYNEKGALQKG